MEHNQDYHISLFKPSSEYARRNRNIIISMFLIWVVAVFGFQILLKVLEKPVAEPSYALFESTYQQVADNTATKDQRQAFITSLLFVLGKDNTPGDRAVLTNSLSYHSHLLVSPSNRSDFLAIVHDDNQIRQKIASLTASYDLQEITYQQYLASKSKMNIVLNDAQSRLKNWLNENQQDIGISDPIMVDLMTFYLHSEPMIMLNPKDAQALPGVMRKYLIHHQSFLTQTRFLGFPFHYWYTAEFLLILFIALCWIYCLRINHLNKRFNITD